jgi:hypothetical protein
MLAGSTRAGGASIVYTTLLPTTTPLPSSTLAISPTITPAPTNTPRPATSTPWPEGIPTFTPSPTYVFEGTYLPPSLPPVFTLPPPAPLIDVDNDVNILLLGSDSPDNYYRRTDVIVLVSINTDAKTVAMWRIPREMFVYIPGYSLDMINTAFARAATIDYPSGSFGMMKDVFRYNFGVEIDHFARVNYPGFLWIIQSLGGLELSVDCGIQDWRIKSPELDPTLEDNWEIYTRPSVTGCTGYSAVVRAQPQNDQRDRPGPPPDGCAARDLAAGPHHGPAGPGARTVAGADAGHRYRYEFYRCAAADPIGRRTRYDARRALQRVG